MPQEQKYPPSPARGGAWWPAHYPQSPYAPDAFNRAPKAGQIMLHQIIIRFTAPASKVGAFGFDQGAQPSITRLCQKGSFKRVGHVGSPPYCGCPNGEAPAERSVKFQILSGFGGRR